IVPPATARRCGDRPRPCVPMAATDEAPYWSDARRFIPDRRSSEPDSFPRLSSNVRTSQALVEVSGLRASLRTRVTPCPATAALWRNTSARWGGALVVYGIAKK
ncbi:MAG: hypothetical protein ACE5NW_19230, partial [Acidiferrobacterales bacterium]